MIVRTDRVSPVASPAVPIPPDTLIEKLNKIETLTIDDTIAPPPAIEKSKSKKLSETQSDPHFGDRTGTESCSSSAECGTGGTVTPVAGSLFEKSFSVKLSLDGRIIARAAEKPIYVCGDSHCLSPAWSVLYLDDTAPPRSPIEFDRIGHTNETNHKHTKNDKTHKNDKRDESGKSVRSVGDDGSEESEKAEKGSEGFRRREGTPRLLVPKLVTGVKQWHLRPQGDFYPKASFQQSVSSIPREADVRNFLCSFFFHFFDFFFFGVLFFFFQLRYCFEIDNLQESLFSNACIILFSYFFVIFSHIFLFFLLFY